MKTKVLFLVTLVFCLSCQKSNSPIPDTKKDKILEEVKAVVEIFTKAAIDADMKTGTQLWHNSPDFIFLNTGYTISYDDAKAGFEFLIEEMINQKATLLQERYTIVDVGTVLYTANYTWEANYKDGLAVRQDPLAILLIFKKINEQWKIIYFVESYTPHGIANTETSKTINQQELHKLFLGTWQGETGPDTTLVWQVKPYGNGYEGSFKYLTQGKIVDKGTQQWGYDEKSGKFILSQISMDKGIKFYTSWFTSQNTCLVLYYDDRTGSYWAPIKWNMEIKSPETIVQSKIINNETVKKVTLKLVK